MNPFRQSASSAHESILPIPTELTGLIDLGLWPRDYDQALKQNLRPILPERIIRLLAPEESNLFLLPPSHFQKVDQLIDGPEEGFWSDPISALTELDSEHTLIIGDFGLGSDAPIALDYRHGGNEPRLIRLKWGIEGNKWVEIAPKFATFADCLKRHAIPSLGSNSCV